MFMWNGNMWHCQRWHEILTSMLFRVLKCMRSCSLLKAWFGYWKLKVENGDSGSSKISKSAISFSSLVSLGTPKYWKSLKWCDFENSRVSLKPKKENIQIAVNITLGAPTGVMGSVIHTAMLPPICPGLGYPGVLPGQLATAASASFYPILQQGEAALLPSNRM